ncbi:MAG: NTP transferase domain-containing protein, partial [Lachnospiraceae bacterium]|nr:NTP transferase domain-containing protein [Lachnospiraceae bacterium]
MKHYGVIMAGGGGTRFWPLSRQDLPKQFLNLTGDDMLVNETISRLQPTIAPQDVYVVTNTAQAEMMREATADLIEPGHILAEPAARGTAACIGYAALEIERRHGEGVMCVFAADHYIKDVAGFNQTLCKAIQLAEETDSLVTIGIRPTFPAVGYGYIKYDATETHRDFHEVLEFVEKPDIMTARQYLAEGGHL